MFKTTAAAEIIQQINPDVKTEAHTYNLVQMAHFAHFGSRLASGSLTGGKVDMVLGCVDNFTARLSINAACCELGVPWFESGVSEDAMGGHLQLIIPGMTACFECVPPLIVASGIPESTLKREGVCAASLPTTMGIVSALLVQNTLKYLLQFGKVSFFVGYSAATDYFPAYAIGPNKECENSHCRALQASWQTNPEQTGRNMGIPSKEEAVAYPSTLTEIEKWLDYRILDQPQQGVVHEDNTFGIVLEASSEPLSAVTNTLETETTQTKNEAAHENGTQAQMPHGLSFSYEIDAKKSTDTQNASEQDKSSTDTTPSGTHQLKSSLADLRARLKDSQK